MATKAKELKPATIEQTQAALAAEDAASFVGVLKSSHYVPEKPDAIPSMKTRTMIQGVAMGVQFSAMLLANKDADNVGWDDYFAFKLNQLSAEMQHFSATGKLPTDAE